MKSLHLLLLCVGISFLAPAKLPLTYCELNVYRPAFKNYLAEIAYGDTSSKHKMRLLRDNSGKKLRFPSELDALNYMARQGWELVSTYHNRGGETRFFLKKS